MKLKTNELLELPFDVTQFKSLSPKSFLLHHTKHHAGYVFNLNHLLDHYVHDTYETIQKYYLIKEQSAKNMKIYNNACQHWNHQFFWNSIRPKLSEIPENIANLILKTYSSIDAFIDAFCTQGTALFGSGWIWIVYKYKEDKIDIMTTANAYIPCDYDFCYPLLTCDVWEHAYYVDFENRRIEFLKEIFLILNWDFAQQRLDECRKNYKNL